MIPKDCKPTRRERDGLITYKPANSFEVDGIRYRPGDLRILFPMFELKNDCDQGCVVTD